MSTWLTAFVVSFFEIAGAFALIVAKASALYPTTQPKAAGEEARETGKDDEGDDDPPAPPPGKGRPGRRPTVMPEEAVAKLRERGGRADGSIRGVGKLLGTRSKTTAHRLLHQLAGDGVVRLQTTPAGCSVALV